ncbi:KRAB-A domain-containing protein 2-like [Palaemon carinicauda]|uniref:KRAB-A domain-containing protein 2-like n=1 Tax=Palaemon carinicauda TaxID=392227 RepID=UPI0035B635E3
MFGAPQIPQNDNGGEFTALVILELKLLWPNPLIDHGKPRHPQSQGSVERLNCDIKDMLISWLGDNDTTYWPMGLRFVQFQKNSSYHSGIKQSPYKALFGVDARVGVRSTALPDEVLKTMITEKDLLGAYSFSSDSTWPDESPEFTNPPDDSPECSAPPNDSPEDFAQPGGSSESSAPPNDSPEDFAQPEGSAYPVSPTCGQNPQGGLHQLQEDIALQWSRASAGQLAQAERMVKCSRLEHVPGDPGENVKIPIPLVDRGKGDPRNVIGVILDRNENDMYRIGVRDWILKGRYSRSQFDICSHQLYSIDEVSADKRNRTSSGSTAII